MSARGFNLVELLLVTAIVAVVAGIALPKYGAALARYRVDSAASRLSADIRAIAETARARSERHAVVIDLASDRYTSYRRYGTADQDAGATIELGVKPYDVDIAKVTYSSGTAITIDGLGRITRGATIVLQHRGEARELVFADEALPSAVLIHATPPIKK